MVAAVSRASWLVVGWMGLEDVDMGYGYTFEGHPLAVTNLLCFTLLLALVFSVSVVLTVYVAVDVVVDVVAVVV